MTYSTLTEVLLDRAKSDSYVNLVNGQEQRQRLPYSELLQRAKARLGQFQAAGLQVGSQLIIQTGDNAAFLEGFWACLLGGITAVPVSGGNSAEHRSKLFRIAQKLNEPGLFTDKQTLVRLADFAAANDFQDTFDKLSKLGFASDQSAPVELAVTVHQPQESDTAFIQFSSGSTSTPKGVVLSHKNLLTNLRSIVHNAQLSASEHQFSWMPLTHDMGLIGFHLTPVFMDNNHSLMPTDVFVRRPGAWLSEVQEAGATILCSPNFGFQHLLKSFKADKHETLDLSCVRLIFNGAEPISVSLCHRFMQTLAPFGLDPDAMFPVYGLAEASLAVTFPSLDATFSTLVIDRTKLGIGQSVTILESRRAQPADAVFAQTVRDDRGVEFVSEGKPVANTHILITGADGAPLADDVTGHICIRGDNVTKGYYAEPELNQAVITADGWLDTGDLGFIHDAQLYITGRSKDIIFVNGQNVYPHDLEEIILQAGLVERGKLAISSQQVAETGQEKLLVFVLHRTDPADLAEQARAMTRLLSEAAGVSVHAVVPVSRIPKTTSGKVQRYLLVQSLEQGEFDILEQQASPDPDEGSEAISADDTAGESQDTASRLLTICNEQVEDMTVKLDDNLFDLGISSLTLAQIHAAIEDTWPEQVDITDLFDYPTVAELAIFLDERNAA
ncbi:non-ribosomal peptide synthetase [Granulosicoccus antarcticus]|uniref:Polyketide synthase PksJ n=1 Tax=Granulosicoccus antarcticus IMCC3135 TaxID=1192854 RepID=A0A2Z2NMI0_9GAMM|nr:non-ribosomal peptide synthetase [Granulosicoccus antarcticus]ASJ72576.1 Polyketide synthase PksJ [Granulosicoccus antarcticus IMCC3135]